MALITKVWRKSTFCSDNSCVEVAFDGGYVVMRDGKNPAGRHLTFTLAEWDAFVRGVKENEFRTF